MTPSASATILCVNFPDAGDRIDQAGILTERELGIIDIAVGVGYRRRSTVRSVALSMPPKTIGWLIPRG
jgi:hypothetical protein